MRVSYTRTIHLPLDEIVIISRRLNIDRNAWSISRLFMLDQSESTEPLSVPCSRFAATPGNASPSGGRAIGHGGGTVKNLTTDRI